MIAEANLHDLHEILSLQKFAYQSEAELYNDYTIHPLRQDLKSLEEEFKKGIILKYITNGKIVGSVRAHMESNVCHIGKLIVHPVYQNLGKGGLLLNAIEEVFANASAFALFTGSKSTKNIEFYKRKGYEIISETEITLNLTFINMEKKSGL